jgi:hypothetical protein
MSEQRVSGGQICNGGLHEVKKSCDIGLDPLLDPSYLTNIESTRPLHNEVL